MIATSENAIMQQHRITSKLRRLSRAQVHNYLHLLTPCYHDTTAHCYFVNFRQEVTSKVIHLH